MSAVLVATVDDYIAFRRTLLFGDAASWGLGTTVYLDPAEGMIGILFTQRMMDAPEPPTVFTDFWTLAHGAMEQL